MNETLLHTFLAEEGNPHVRKKLLDAIHTVGDPKITEFAFNRFNVYLDSGTRQAVIEDDLVIGPEGKCTVGFKELELLLRP